MYLLWLLPTLAVAAAIVSGRLNTTHAALLGLVLLLAMAVGVVSMR
jgi:lactate permease